MYWSEQITLMKDEPEKVQGVLTHNYSEVRTVYGERKSVKWGEFFAAEAAGTTLTAVFVLHADEYCGERVISWNGNLYSVQRAFGAMKLHSSWPNLLTWMPLLQKCCRVQLPSHPMR